MKPWLGWGYFGFWQLTNPAALEISDAVHWVVPNAHNGLLEFLLDVGVLGTALFAFILIRTIVLAVRCLRTPERALAISTISCCAGILLVGVSETVLLASNQSSTSVMFITGLMCERAAQAAKRRRYVRYRAQARSDRPAGLRNAREVSHDKVITQRHFCLKLWGLYVQQSEDLKSNFAQHARHIKEETE